MDNELIKLVLCVIAAGFFIQYLVFIWCFPCRSQSLYRDPAALAMRFGASQPPPHVTHAGPAMGLWGWEL